MPQPVDIDFLITRFADDRDALSDEELAQLVAAMKVTPALAARLHQQLVMDDALSQRLTVDRRNFLAQVEQRVADHLRGEEELARQADELQVAAVTRTDFLPEESASSIRFLISMAATLLLALGVSFFFWQQSRTDQALLAKVESVEGDVVLKRLSGEDEHAKTDMSIQRGDRLMVTENASISLKWLDGTVVRLEPGTVINMPLSTKSAKRMLVDRGRLAAVVAKQPTGRPMVFQTPHAEAIVRGTELYLEVGDHETELEVAEGQVELMEHDTQDVQMVAASESAVATSGEKVAKRALVWPTSREGLVYLFAGSQRPALVRSIWTLTNTKIEPRDGSRFNYQGEMHTGGGWFVDNAAAVDLASQLRTTNDFSLETVLAPEALTTTPTSILSLETSGQPLLSLMQRDGLHLELATGAGKKFDVGALPEVGKLTHVMITCVSGKTKVWMDGVETQTAAWSPGGLGEGAATRLAIGGSPTDQRWHGRIAGLAIYNRALSGEEVAKAFAGR